MLTLHTQFFQHLWLHPVPTVPSLLPLISSCSKSKGSQSKVKHTMNLIVLFSPVNYRWWSQVTPDGQRRWRNFLSAPVCNQQQRGLLTDVSVFLLLLPERENPKWPLLSTSSSDSENNVDTRHSRGFVKPLASTLQREGRSAGRDVWMHSSLNRTWETERKPVNLLHHIPFTYTAHVGFLLYKKQDITVYSLQIQAANTFLCRRRRIHQNPSCEHLFPSYQRINQSKLGGPFPAGPWRLVCSLSLPLPRIIQVTLPAQSINTQMFCLSVWVCFSQRLSFRILKMSHSSITGLLAQFFWLEGKLVRPRHPLLALLNFSNNVFAVFGNLYHKSFLMIWASKH